MIRIVMMLLLIAAVFVSLLVFPDIANQRVRIEILGWLFETRTAMFILLIIFSLSALWLVQKTFALSINSPKQLWTNLRSGNKKRRELRLQEALDTWIDEGEGHSQKLLKRSKGIIPPWLHDALIVWWDKPENHAPIHDEKDKPHIIALKARLATEPNQTHLSLEQRQQYLDAWLMVHPGASLALERKAALLGERGEYAEQVALLEDLFQRKKQVQHIRPQLATALRHLAKQDSDNALTYLRKSNRINPTDVKTLMNLAQTLQTSGDTQTAYRLLLDYLAQHDDMQVAKALLPMLENDALQHFKQVDKAVYQTTAAGTWLRMQLAHKAGLSGIADDSLYGLLENHESAELWQLRGDWYAEQGQWQQAAEAYQKANQLH
ncbi:tetratricopeptide repeat protein [Ghiorsea bivora]|uniref:tetratricopeptide repeat protein n=1 Tax=Ghiorsea bivora TaxID=1485545 RepID=UPI00056FEE6B|nr:tetratricopeptide repeat protein [Ghiorsea bivora]